MSAHTRVLGLLVASLAFAASVRAQTYQGVTIAAHGGGINGATDLNDAGTADFKKTGYNVGGTISIDLLEFLAVRGDFTFARNELQQNAIATGQDLNRFFYDGAVQFQYDANGLKPYVYVGAGAVTLHPVATTNADKTKFAGTGGIGVNYSLPGTNLGVLIESQAWVYSAKDLAGPLAGFDKTQVDVTWSAGLSYRLPFTKTAAARQ